MSRPTPSVVASLGRLSARWLKKDFPFRRRAVRRLVQRSGFSAAMAEAMIDAVFRELTAPKLRALLRAELGDASVLDRFHEGRRARGPETVLHVFASNAPQAPVVSFVLGMLVQSRNVGKLSSRDEGFLSVYLDSLERSDRALWRTNSLLPPKDRAAFAAEAKKAGLVVAYGSEKSLAEIRKSVPASTPFVPYGHRVSAAVYLKEALGRKSAAGLAAAAARDVWMIDQRGCLSPVTLYVQKGGPVAPKEFAALLAKELQKLQKKEKAPPRRDLTSQAAAHALFGRHLVERLRGGSSSLWESRPRGLWAVTYGEGAKLLPAASCQAIAVQGFRDEREALSSLAPLRRHLQCVALEGSAAKKAALAEALSRLGATRICRAGRMQRPPAAWPHDGRPNLAGWLRWTGLE